MRITEAKLCLSCDEVHTGPECPVCTKGPSIFIKKFLDLEDKLNPKEEKNEKLKSN